MIYGIQIPEKRIISAIGVMKKKKKNKSEITTKLVTTARKEVEVEVEVRYFWLRDAFTKI